MAGATPLLVTSPTALAPNGPGQYGRGVALTQRIRAQLPQIQVVILSSVSDQDELRDVYASRGQAEAFRVCVGSLCRRNSLAEIRSIVTHVAEVLPKSV
jgi:hypothetical protein